MFNPIGDDNKMQLDNELLDKMINEVKRFGRIINKNYDSSLRNMQDLIDYQKSFASLPQKFDHFLDGVWSSKACNTGPDTCGCSLRIWKPETYMRWCLDMIGFDMMFWIMKIDEEKLKKLNESEQLP